MSSPDHPPDPEEPAVPISKGLIIAGVLAVVLGLCAGILMSSVVLR